MARYIDADRDSFPTLHQKELNDYMKGWNACLKSVLQQPTADVEKVNHIDLRVEIRTDRFKNQELAKKQGWYRKYFYCSNCGSLIRSETWDDHCMFGKGSVLKNNETPKCCPECGSKIRGDAE